MKNIAGGLWRRAAAVHVLMRMSHIILLELYKAFIGRQSGDVVVKHIQSLLMSVMREYTYLKAPADKSQAGQAELAVYWTVSSLLTLTA